MNSLLKAVDTSPLDDVAHLVSFDNGRAVGHYAGVAIHSVFQPIVSPTHHRVIGHEALMRPTGASPLELIAQADRRGDSPALDRISRLTHLSNFTHQSAEGESWLFLNVDGRVFVDEWQGVAPIQPGVLPNERIVLEVLESSKIDVQPLAEAARVYRRMGYLVAIDDFGAGESNFERIWALQPDIVKLDISMTRRVTEAKSERIVRHLVALLHQIGVLVVAEGVETLAEAKGLMAADVDFFQGYWFKRPQPDLLSDQQCLDQSLESLWQAYRSDRVRRDGDRQTALRPIKAALKAASIEWQQSGDIDRASRPIFDTPGSVGIAVINADGRVIAAPQRPAGRKPVDPRFRNLETNASSDLSRRNYFQQALANPGKVVYVGPQASYSEDSSIYIAALFSAGAVICAAFNEGAESL